MTVDIRVSETGGDVEIVDKRDTVVVGLVGGVGGGLGFGIGMPLTMALGVGHLGLGPLSALLGLGWLSIVWLGLRLILSSWHKKREKAMDKLRAEIERILEMN